MAILFPLSLRGFGTVDIEALGSYLHRQASHHGVSVNRLVTESYAWYKQAHNLPPHEYLVRSCGSLSCLSRPKQLTSDLIKVIEYVTGEVNLRSSTFLALYDALDRSVGQFASHFRWCPSCFYEFLLADDPGYYKLLWLILDVTHCPEHRVPLIDKCPHCGAFQDGFGHKENCTTCQRCGEDLGYLAQPSQIIPSWEVNAVDLLSLVEEIAKNPDLHYPKDGIKNLLSGIFEKAWDNHQEDILWNKIPRDEYLSLTCGNSTVSLQIARRFSARLGVDLTDLLTGRIDSLPGILDPEWFKDIPSHLKPKKRTSRHNRGEIYSKLLHFIAVSDNPLPLIQVAKSLGVSKGYIDHHFPEISDKIVKNHQKWMINKLQEKRRAAKAEALRYFTQRNYSNNNYSRKHALKSIHETTGLPINILREEIQTIYTLLFLTM